MMKSQIIKEKKRKNRKQFIINIFISWTENNFPLLVANILFYVKNTKYIFTNSFFFTL